MNPGRHAIIFLVRVYQCALSPILRGLLGPAGECRFTPSCSHYACDAVRVLGVLKGGALATWRVCRCNPWGGCGDDPVPEAKTPGMESAGTSPVAGAAKPHAECARIVCT